MSKEKTKEKRLAIAAGVNPKFSIKNMNDALKPFFNEIMMEVNADLMEKITTSNNKDVMRMAYGLSSELNIMERMYPPKDPALEGLRTDQWVTTIKQDQIDFSQSIRKNEYGGRAGVKIKVEVWNMQTPFVYRFDMRSMYKYGGGKMLLSDPLWEMTKKNKMDLQKKVGKRGIITEQMMDESFKRLDVEKFNGYKQKTARKYLGSKKQTTYTTKDTNDFSYFSNDYSDKRYKTDTIVKQYKETMIKDHGKSAKSGNVVGGRNFHTVGNLAAVRLDQKHTPTVRPVNAKKIVFWVTNIRRIDNKGKSKWGAPSSYGKFEIAGANGEIKKRMGGYVFTTKRKHAGEGHKNYYNAVSKILKKYLPSKKTNDNGLIVDNILARMDKR